MARAVFAALLALVLALPAAAQDVAALDWLTGSWRGAGTMSGSGADSEAALEVRPVLGGRFLELSWRAGRFEGRAFYRPAGERRWRGTWFDNRGMSFPIEARLEGQGSVLVADWGSAETERGRTVYVLTDGGRLVITDAVRRADGNYRVFAEHALTRAPAD